MDHGTQGPLETGNGPQLTASKKLSFAAPETEFFQRLNEQEMASLREPPEGDTACRYLGFSLALDF